MSKKKRSKLWPAAGAVLLGMTVALGFTELPAFASGKTEVSLGVTLAPTVVSFDVPLYLTLCVTKNGGNTNVIVPKDSYTIRNKSGSTKLAVTGLQVTGVAGGEWELTTSFSPADTGKKISLNIGGVDLPHVPAASNTAQEADLTVGESAFYDFANRRFKVIGEGGSNPAETVLPIRAAVPDGYSPVDQAKPTPQFRIRYTVSRLDSDGNVIDKDYDGPTAGGITASSTP